MLDDEGLVQAPNKQSRRFDADWAAAWWTLLLCVQYVSFTLFFFTSEHRERQRPLLASRVLPPNPPGKAPETWPG